jgi:dCTP diphosphatase
MWNNPHMQFDQLRRDLREFADERDWSEFHTLKNLTLALAGEVGELAEVIQWIKNPDAQYLTENPQVKQSFSEELADVLLYLIRLSDVAEIDLYNVTRAKMAKNAERYTVEKSKGNAEKQR